MTIDGYPNELVLPVRGGYTRDGQIDPRFRRNFRAIEEWANSPHRTYGSRMIAPEYFASDETDHAFTAQPAGSAFTGVGTDVFDAITLEIDRRMRAFVIAVTVFDNTDAATDYNAYFYLPINIVSGPSAGQSTGRATLQWRNHGAPGRATMTNIRSKLLDFVPEPGTPRTTVNFRWGYKQGDASAQDITIYRQKMIVAVFDAPDIPDDNGVVWTNSASTKTAYRNGEGDDT